MRVITSSRSIQKTCLLNKKRGFSIALVPTMGFLHEGHLSLLKAARRKADKVILTIFVNPLQFGPKEDFKRYPRNLMRDLAYAKRTGIDCVFSPRTEELYTPDYETYVEVSRLSRGLCGRTRPTHFRGVATVVLKLINLTQPDWAFFGLKDYQQYRVIQKMVTDLNLPVRIQGMPIVREKDGLAMSSRNTYLNSEERRQARVLYRALSDVRGKIKHGDTNIPQLVSFIRRQILSQPLTRIDYVSCLDSQTLQSQKKYRRRRTLFALAVWVGKTRLIDNVVV